MSYCVYYFVVYPVKRRQQTDGVCSGGGCNATVVVQKALPVWKPQNARRSSRKQNGAFFR